MSREHEGMMAEERADDDDEYGDNELHNDDPLEVDEDLASTVLFPLHASPYHIFSSAQDRQHGTCGDTPSTKAWSALAPTLPT